MVDYRPEATIKVIHEPDVIKRPLLVLELA